MQFATKQLFPRNIKGFQERGSASQNAYKHNAFLMNLVSFRARGSKSSINDRFYKGSETGFCSLRESKFSLGMLRVWTFAEVHHRMLINVIVSQ